ncbi:beta-carotene oxygenase 2b isoform X5 [Salmo salar]|uniref:Carotenoid-cleaving dioxygenase, mitochondrial n=1 Tax=Salmo salar TaxID=8030 RepID=A0A1S3RFU4_SALSA|nr:beta-carotene oxygenase 2b isoform X5 [Salmo salar]|eukprot:XP_014051170.1 PREDICTED: beta-carotene oxygenase 2b isoform X5 [Salmo salar]
MPPVKLEVSDATITPSSDAKPKQLNKCNQLELKGLESIAPLVRSVEETPEPIATEVCGTIPTWIRGSLLRNGPGKFEFGNQHYNHWFDGMAMLHQFKIEDGKVTYRSRFLQSDAYKKNSERDRIMVSEFGTVAMPDPCKNFFLRFLSRFEMIGALYNIIKVPPMKNNPEETLEGAKVLCSIVPADKARPSYYHSFAMSENYVVFIEQPIKMDLLKIVTAKLRGKGISEGVYWDPKQDTVFHLVDKHKGQTSSVKFHTKALSVFHQINAFEEDGFLMLDMCCSDNGEAINNYLIQNLRKSGEALDQVYNTMYRAFPRRFVLPLNVTNNTPTGVNLNTRPASSATSFKTAIDKVVCQFEDLHGEDLYEYGGLEFPQINYSKFNTRPYRYFYGCGFRHLVGDSLLKIDLEGKKVKVWYQKGLFPSEPVFVPSPEAVEEDDGVILSVVVTPTEDKSTFLLVLDAKTWEELGRAEVPVNIPYGFHGTFNTTA